MWTESETDKLTQQPSAANSTSIGEPKKKPKPLPDVILGYITAFMWVCASVVCLYYTNFFYQLFHSPKIYEPFFTISMVSYTVIIVLTLYISFVLPHFYKVENV